MPERDPQNLNFYWSTLFVRSLFEQGLRNVVISPGSRSTPLVLAFAAHPGFKKLSITDERSAAFTALGLAKASGMPAVLVCTSGTAVANYLPAVIETTQSGVPMIITSADRPPHLRGTGASQSIDQLKIFGDYPVFFHEVGEPRDSTKATQRLETAAFQAVEKARSLNGVSHLNFAFSKPFEPETDFMEVIEAENEKHAKGAYPVYKISENPKHFDEHFWSDLISAERPLIVAGPTALSDFPLPVQELAKVLKAPVLAEPGSNIPSSKYTITGFDGFLRSHEITEELEPDLILRFGREPVSKALSFFLDEFSYVFQIRFQHPRLWGDESLSAHKHITLSGQIEIPDVDGAAKSNWLKSWKAHQKDFINFREEQLHPVSPLTDGYVFSSLSQLIPKKSFTMLSNSFPVRDMSLFGDFDGKEVYVNRGAAGIDGITSTAIGLSLDLEKPGFLFIGDIAFLHDTNALMNAKLVSQPLIIVVLNNGGGTIFRMLPVNQYKKKYSDYFETPQDISLAALCRAYKIDHNLISRPEQLITHFENKLEKPGVHVLECITDAEDSMDLRKTLWNYSPEIS